MTEGSAISISYEAVPLIVFVILIGYPQLEPLMELLSGFGVASLFVILAGILYKSGLDIRLSKYLASRRVKKLFKERSDQTVSQLLWFDLKKSTKAPLDLIRLVSHRKVQLIEEVQGFSETKLHRGQSLIVSGSSWGFACILFQGLMTSGTDYLASAMASFLIGTMTLCVLSYFLVFKKRDIAEAHLAMTALTIIKNELGDKPAETQWGDLAAEYSVLLSRMESKYYDQLLTGYRRFWTSYQEATKSDVMKQALNGLASHWIEEFLENGQISDKSELREILPVLEIIAQDDRLAHLLEASLDNELSREPLTIYELTPVLSDTLQDELANQAFNLLDEKRLVKLIDLRREWLSGGWCLRPSWSPLYIGIVDKYPVENLEARAIICESLRNHGAGQFDGVGSRVVQFILDILPKASEEFGLDSRGLKRNLMHRVNGNGLKTLVDRVNDDDEKTELVVEIGKRVQKEKHDKSIKEAYELAKARASSGVTVERIEE